MGPILSRHVTRRWTPGVVFTGLALASWWMPGLGGVAPADLGACALACEGQPVWSVKQQRRSEGADATGIASRARHCTRTATSHPTRWRGHRRVHVDGTLIGPRTPATWTPASLHR